MSKVNLIGMYELQSQMMVWLPILKLLQQIIRIAQLNIPSQIKGVFGVVHPLSMGNQNVQRMAGNVINVKVLDISSQCAETNRQDSHQV